MRAFLARGADAVSVLFSFVRNNKITFSEFLEELEELGLKGRTFGPECYRRALERFLRLRIELLVVDDAGDSETRRAFIEKGHTAALWYRPERNLAQVFVLSSLPPLEMTAAVYHELSHLAAGHHMRIGAPLAGRKLTRAHRRRLARRPPPALEKQRETEARIREEYCMLAGALGPACLEDETLRQVR